MTIEKWFHVFVAIGSRYLLAAGIAFLLFYVLLNRKLTFKKLQQKHPSFKDYIREIGFSLITICIFTFVFWILMFYEPMARYNQVYKPVSKLGWWYFWGLFPVLFFVHDTYFYWTHRLMHHPRLFKAFHLVHHRSTNPTPWAAYAFHPLEAVVEAGVFVLFIYAFPITFLHIGLFFLAMIIYNVYGHLGYELYPSWLNRFWLTKWINTSVSHNQHHQYFKGNYGLYFTIWDRWMGTLRSDYEQGFEKATTAKKT